MAVNDEDLWRANVARFAEAIVGVFDDRAIARALEGAWRTNPDYFPTLARLVDACKAAEKNLGVLDRKALPEVSSATDACKNKDLAMRYVDAILKGHGHQEVLELLELDTGDSELSPQETDTSTRAGLLAAARRPFNGHLGDVYDDDSAR